MGASEKQRQNLQKAVIEAVENLSLLEGVCGEPQGFPQDEGMHQASLTLCSPEQVCFELWISEALLEDIVQTLYGVEREEITQSLENEVLADLLNAIAEKVAPEVEGVEDDECMAACCFQQEGKKLYVSWRRVHLLRQRQVESAAELNGGLTID